MRKTENSLLFVVLLMITITLMTLPSAGQTRSKRAKPKIISVKGLLCDKAYGSGLGYRVFRTSRGIIGFEYAYGAVKEYGSESDKSEEIGAEYVIKYVINKEGNPIVRSFTFTGKVERIEPCSG